MWRISENQKQLPGAKTTLPGNAVRNRMLTRHFISLFSPLVFLSPSRVLDCQSNAENWQSKNVCTSQLRYHKAEYSTQERVWLQENIFIISTLALVILQHIKIQHPFGNNCFGESCVNHFWLMELVEKSTWVFLFIVKYRVYRVKFMI